MKPHFLFRVFMAGSTAVLIAGPVILSLLLGLWLDGLMGTSPVFALIGGLLGFVGSILSLLKILKTTK
jgi:F0F1-type ATP synthase assembly protein I